ncbi:uncharacterized protein LOC119109558 [Pollicipes pollicipes]|uniref:uncharacterized protein LOC119109558 n=1 Tax=Pollicipes pollicipes TaxID=41117 RepID=UPI001885890B|nr:uncharacterized protein LOC119109558 [Pollicipes pollicipes]
MCSLWILLQVFGVMLGAPRAATSDLHIAAAYYEYGHEYEHKDEGYYGPYEDDYEHEHEYEHEYEYEHDFVHVVPTPPIYHQDSKIHSEGRPSAISVQRPQSITVSKVTVSTAIEIPCSPGFKRCNNDCCYQETPKPPCRGGAQRTVGGCPPTFH